MFTYAIRKTLIKDCFYSCNFTYIFILVSLAYWNISFQENVGKSVKSLRFAGHFWDTVSHIKSLIYCGEWGITSQARYDVKELDWFGFVLLSFEERRTVIGKFSWTLSTSPFGFSGRSIINESSESLATKKEIYDKGHLLGKNLD